MKSKSCVSGLVAEYIVAIDVARARFPADAKAAAPLAWDRGAAGCLPVLPQSLCHTETASMVYLGLCHLCICSRGTAAQPQRMSQRLAPRACMVDLGAAQSLWLKFVSCPAGAVGSASLSQRPGRRATIKR